MTTKPSRLTPQETAIAHEAVQNLELMLQNIAGGFLNLARRRAAFAAELMGVG